jgi:hypothetical protein
VHRYSESMMIIMKEIGETNGNAFSKDWDNNKRHKPAYHSASSSRMPYLTDKSETFNEQYNIEPFRVK